MTKRVSRTAGTRLSNGKQFFLESSVDGRSLIARRFREVQSAIVSDLGGESSISEAEMALVRRAVTLVVNCEMYESRMAETGKLDSEAYLPCVNALGKLLNALGLKRRPRQVGTSPLDGYHAANAPAREPEILDAEPVGDVRHAPRRINEAIAAAANGEAARPTRLIRAVRS